MQGLKNKLDKVKNNIPGLKDSEETSRRREKENDEISQDRREKEAAIAAQKEADRAEDRRRKEELHQVKMDKLKQQTNEVYDPEVQGRSQIRKTGEGGRVGRDRRKSEPERRRMKATGGGKSEPVSYKDRKDIGSQKQAATRVQQPTKERGSEEVKQSYADKVKAERKAAALARRQAAERKAAALARRQAKSGGGEVKKTTTSSKDAEKQASKLLTKKTPEKKVDPDYKPAKASGMTRAERMKQQRKGETMLRGIFKDQETAKYKKETGVNPDAKGRTKIMGRVHKRMST
jgi:hypothetical protein